jgi:acyl carrier protein
MNHCTEAQFAAHLLAFINETIPSLDRRERRWPPVERDTPLFADGLLDSLSILHLIARVEELTGTPVPDHLVVMRNFQSVETITAVFSPK